MSLQSRDAGSLPQKRGIRLLCRYFYYCKTLCNCNVKNKVITILCNNTFQSFSFLLKRKQGKTSFWKRCFEENISQKIGPSDTFWSAILSNFYWYAKKGYFWIQRGQGIMKISLLFILVHQEAEKLAKRKSELFF